MNLDEANEVLSKKPSAFTEALRNCRDAAAAVRNGHQTPGGFEHAERRFWDSIVGRSLPEQLALAETHYQELSAELLQREQEKLAAAAYVKQREEGMREMARERAAQQAFVLRHTRPLLGDGQGLIKRLEVFLADLGGVSSADEFAALNKRIAAEFASFNATAKAAVARAADIEKEVA